MKLISALRFCNKIWNKSERCNCNQHDKSMINVDLHWHGSVTYLAWLSWQNRQVYVVWVAADTVHNSLSLRMVWVWRVPAVRDREQSHGTGYHQHSGTSDADEVQASLEQPAVTDITGRHKEHQWSRCCCRELKITSGLFFGIQVAT